MSERKNKETREFMSSRNKVKRAWNEHNVEKKLDTTRNATESDQETDKSDSRKPNKLLKFSKTSSSTFGDVGTSNGTIVAAHYNELKEKNCEKRKQSNIFYMRNLNNWIKMVLIKEYMALIKGRQRYGDALRVLDLCCGKGGDLLKWRHGVSHLIATDIAEVSIGHCMERYETLKRGARYPHSLYTAEFFACDATKNLIRAQFRDPSSKVQITSCQFAFHYCFESFKQANVMVKNASDCLEEGGYFLCTIPDANEIMRRLHNSSDKKSFGNSCYSIDFKCNINPPPLFGAKYLFKLDEVVDCPEFLVHFPTMVQLCRRYGLILRRSNTFVEYFEEKQKSEEILLKRMNCFKDVDTNTVTADNMEYEHVFKFKRYHGNTTVRTLSKSEWEAFCLYKLCVFQKCKSIIGKDGHPEYIFDDDHKSSNDHNRGNKRNSSSSSKPHASESPPPIFTKSTRTTSNQRQH